MKYLFASKNSGVAVINAEDYVQAYKKLELLYPYWAWTYEFICTCDNITIII